MSTTESHELTDSEFDRGIALRPRVGEPEVHDGHLDAGWQVGAGINGGLLLAVAANALKQRFTGERHPDPVSISAYYLSASRSGAAILNTDVVRQGRTMSTGQVSLLQPEGDGSCIERIRAIGTFG
ncbi:MAG TPA: acyl-CoA thioesterase domain-containing protein, partial [Nocardioidaceae bacterium]|nr:acyl-CoA thioesterase domain-containing protein [Nocardioidaceae bacterium]